MLTYLDYTLSSLRGNRALCGYTNTSLPVKTITTDINCLTKIGTSDLWYTF